MPKIDLHIHTNASDGKLSPKELVDWAIEKKVPAIAITDHNLVSGCNCAMEYVEGKDLEVVPGIEITTTPPEGAKELHIVGLFIDLENEKILAISEKLKEYSINAAKEVIENLNDLGYKISFEELLEKSDGNYFGRPIMAEILMEKYPDEFPEREKVFDELLGQNGKAFVKPRGLGVEESINIIHGAGGIAIVAHPWYLGGNIEKILKNFSELGGDGIESLLILKKN